MYQNFTFPSVNEALPSLLGALFEEGLEIGSRAGVTKELTHVGITLTEPLDREILIDHRKPNLAAQIAETMWVLGGRDDIEWLSNYLPRAKDFSDDGVAWRAGYGKRLRRWEDHAHAKTVDQWRWLVEHLKEDRASRRAVMSIWDPVIDTEPGKDIPCNDWLSFISRSGYLDLHVAIRSNDIIWGWSGINQFEWSALLEITAGLIGAKPGWLHFSTTSFHIYDHHFAKADKITEQTLQSLDHLLASPRFDVSYLDTFDFDDLDRLIERWFRVEYDIRTGSPLVQHYVDTFPEPMLRSWLRVLQWWWSEGDRSYLTPLRGTRLEAATLFSVQPKKTTSALIVGSLKTPNLTVSSETTEIRSDSGHLVARLPNMSPFLEHAINTHNEKHEAYGDSWKRRGEMLGIMANIARKIDRLGGAETSDETSADTAMDLMVYLAKYRTWLDDYVFRQDGPVFPLSRSDDPRFANDLLLKIERHPPMLGMSNPSLEGWLTKTFDRLEDAVNRGDTMRFEIVDSMLEASYILARRLFEAADEYRGADSD